MWTSILRPQNSLGRIQIAWGLRQLRLQTHSFHHWHPGRTVQPFHHNTLGFSLCTHCHCAGWPEPLWPTRTSRAQYVSPRTILASSGTLSALNEHPSVVSFQLEHKLYMCCHSIFFSVPIIFRLDFYCVSFNFSFSQVCCLHALPLQSTAHNSGQFWSWQTRQAHSWPSLLPVPSQEDQTCQTISLTALDDRPQESRPFPFSKQ